MRLHAPLRQSLDTAAAGPYGEWVQTRRAVRREHELVPAPLAAAAAG